ncbi:MAG: hypothetical protein KR126chlam6_00417 [Candidatus Anoxychlamydiales bacterium]|nr:hypothetical protein [Candidatus Anoxychlamydiales bacterium]
MRFFFSFVLGIEFFLSTFVFANEKDVKIYDCFPFFNELELLEVRLNELYDVVDHFVIVENPLTQSGNEKKLYFEENKQRFAKFLDKIIHIVGPKREKPLSDWHRENAQRNDIMLGLKDAKDEDIVIISDLDEIVREEKISEIKDLIKGNKDPLRLNLKMYRYFLNRRDMNIDIWALGYAASYKTIKEYSPQHLRCDYSYTHYLDNAGWHFTDMGWISRFAYKINSCAHQERNIPRWKKAYKVMRWARRCKLVKIDETYPKFITRNLKYFKNRNFIDDNLPPNWNMRVFNKRQKNLERTEKTL